jgi:hypothetical protein
MRSTRLLFLYLLMLVPMSLGLASRRPTHLGVQYGGLSECMAASHPKTATAFSCSRQRLTSERMELPIDELAEAHANSFNILLIDNVGAHIAERLMLASNVAAVFQLRASPELNPAE